MSENLALITEAGMRDAKAGVPTSWQSLRLGVTERDNLKTALRAHPRWRQVWEAYRKLMQIDASGLTREHLFALCNILGLDAVTASAASGEDKHDQQEAAAPRSLPPATPQSGLASLGSGLAKAKEMQGSLNLDQRAIAVARQLTEMLAAPVSAPLDEDKVRFIVEELSARREAGLIKKVAEASSEIANTTLNEVRAMIEAGGITRVELTKDGVKLGEIDTAHPMFATLAKATAARMSNGYYPNIWLAGPAGSGKTHAAHQLAGARGLAFHHNGALSMAHELLGFVDAGGTYHRTAFREAYEHGGVYLFDEVDGSDNAALLALNAALANGNAQFPDGAITRHADCIIIATANTWGLGATAEYVGRSKIDAAFLSRFPVRLAWDYDNKLETVLAGQFPAWAKRVQKAREKARKAGLKVLIDPRATQAGAALLAAGFGENEAASLTYLANLTPEQRNMVEG